MSQTSQLQIHRREEKQPGNQVEHNFLQPWREQKITKLYSLHREMAKMTKEQDKHRSLKKL